MSEIETHRALVTNNNDPDKLGKIKVKCASLLDEEQELPFWILPKFHFIDLAGGGWFGVPAIDTWVNIEVPTTSRWDEVPFEQSLQMSDIRWVCTVYNTVQKLPKIFETNYPDRSGYAWRNGWVLYIDSKTGEMGLGYYPDYQTPEAWIKILKDHSIFIENKDGMKLHLLPSKVLLEAAGAVEIVGDNIKIGGSAATEPIVLGNVLNTFLTQFATTWAATHVHPVTAVGSPTGPPTVAPPAVPGNLLSTKHTVE